MSVSDPVAIVGFCQWCDRPFELLPERPFPVKVCSHCDVGHDAKTCAECMLLKKIDQFSGRGPNSEGGL